MPALFVGGVLLVLIGGFGFTRAEQAEAAASRRTGEHRHGTAEPNRKRKAAGKLTLRAVAAETDEPIEGVSIEYRVRLRREASGGDHHDRRGRHGGDRMGLRSDGPSTLDSPRASRSSCRSTSSGTTQRHPVELPASRSCGSSRAPRSAASCRTRPAIRSQASRSTSTRRRPSTKGEHHVFTLGSPKTDAQGRWRLDVAPKDLAEVVGPDEPSALSAAATSSRRATSTA